MARCSIFSGIRAVGFDLDGTLYPPNQDIDDAIRERISAGLKLLFPELGTIRQIRLHYDELYSHYGSMTLILEKLGVPDPSEFAHKCLADARVHRFLQRDAPLIAMLESLGQRYFTFLITNSPQNLAIEKLDRLGIKLNLFNYTAFGDTDSTVPLYEQWDKPFKSFLLQSPYPPKQHLFLGDNLKSDILLPKSLGMRTCAVGLDCEQADYCLPNIHDLSRYLPKTALTQQSF